MFKKNDIVVVKFPFTNLSYTKARPAVIISNEFFHQKNRNDYILLAISSARSNKLNIEPVIKDWQEAGLLNKSFFKANITTINKSLLIQKLGEITLNDQKTLDNFIKKIIH